MMLQYSDFCGGLLKIKTKNIKSRDGLVWNCVKLWIEENGQEKETATDQGRQQEDPE